MEEEIHTNLITVHGKVIVVYKENMSSTHEILTAMQICLLSLATKNTDERLIINI